MPWIVHSLVWIDIFGLHFCMCTIHSYFLLSRRKMSIHICICICIFACLFGCCKTMYLVLAVVRGLPHWVNLGLSFADISSAILFSQLRGRVGRADKEAHAYLFYPDKSLLSDQALVWSWTLVTYFINGMIARFPFLLMFSTESLIVSLKSNETKTVGCEIAGPAWHCGSLWCIMFTQGHRVISSTGHVTLLMLYLLFTI